MRPPRPLLAAALALAGVASAAAQLVLLPDELTVAEVSSDTHHLPAVALVRDGSLIVWEDDARGLVSRRFAADSSAASGSQLLVPNDPMPALPFGDRVRHEAHEVAIAARPDGSFIAVWVDVKLRHSHDGFSERRLVVSQQVAARFFDPASRPASRVWKVSGLDGVASRPRIAQSGNRFLITWHERGGSQPGVHLTTIGRKGPSRDVLVGARGWHPAIAAGGRGAMVAWVKCCGPEGGYELLGQRLDNAGRLAGQPFRAATDLPRGAHGPAVAVAGQPGGDFLVAYQRLRESDLTMQIHGQLVSAQGDLVGGELPISINYGTGHSAPVAGALAGGGWVVGWMTWVNSFRVGTTLTALGPLGNALGNSIDVNERAIAGLEMGLASGVDGRVLAAWEGFDRWGKQGLRARAVLAH